ncbi:MAG: Do family serine endopeptidase, partial [Nevskia sp.]|nr:Do family serine endopeptidase [Nevskia sp.]
MRFAASVLRIVSIGALTLAAGCSHQTGSLPDFADLVDQVSPSVVNISAVTAEPPSEEASDDSQGQVPDWLKKFLDKHGKNGKPGDSGDGSSSGGDNPDLGGGDGDLGSGPGGEQSLGSGFILSEDGYILTNQHVVSDAKEVTVRLSDHRQLPAQVVGSDERADIALLKIDAKGLPAVKLADMKKTRVGEWVLAIGSPFGFDYSVTAGIISAKGRNLDTEQYVPFIQTDAAINPGNSGGPLFNLRGEVVGVNSQIYSQTGGFMGVAFAIPIDIASKVARELKDKGKVTRGWLGVVVQEVDRNLAKSFNLPKPEGALVARVLPDSPAQQAGLKAGDVLLRYNGAELVSSRSLPPLVGDSTPGDTVTLELLRDGRSITVKIEIGTLDTQDQPDEDNAAPGAPHKPKAPDHAQAPQGAVQGPPLGLTVRDLSAEERSKAKVIAGGVRVDTVGPGPGRDGGVLDGDVILSMGGQEV